MILGRRSPDHPRAIPDHRLRVTDSWPGCTKLEGMSDAADWTARRRDAAQEHAARAARTRAAETVRAREKIAAFVAEARRRGLATTVLVARSGDRKGNYRTGLTGWYLTREGTLGVSEDGGYYVLACLPSLIGRLRGIELEPADPPLQVGAGARDGESIALDALLAMRLDAGDAWTQTR